MGRSCESGVLHYSISFAVKPAVHECCSMTEVAMDSICLSIDHHQEWRHRLQIQARKPSNWNHGGAGTLPVRPGSAHLIWPTDPYPGRAQIWCQNLIGKYTRDEPLHNPMHVRQDVKSTSRINSYRTGKILGKIFYSNTLIHVNSTQCNASLMQVYTRASYASKCSRCSICA
jgi:hypothetical protein